ncbi:hypothetical protein [Calderihabitans maritimus]|uniref:Uncharacterized protein n=1 Tax=Calderihabitans maritimus TaxID=1246530 RepID=A0A1Z5HQ22_9FIRM|nr:hypothetical protein [Calderihabitans maritimus]GAW91395.1 hypothetical protein KKC1_05570 [Calderihabitans maritimus]
MFKKLVKLSLVIALVFVLFAGQVLAGDVLHRLTHGDQYALILGSVLEVNEGEIEVEVKKILSGRKTPSRVAVELGNYPLTFDLKRGDHVIISVDRFNKQFTVKWGIFKVSSDDYSTLEIIDSDLYPGDLAALQHYINSGGNDNDFVSINGRTYLRNPDGTLAQIYPPTGRGMGNSKDQTEKKLEPMGYKDKMFLASWLNFIIYGAIIVFVIKSFQEILRTKSVVLVKPLLYALVIAVLLSVQGMILNGINGDKTIIYAFWLKAGVALLIGLILELSLIVKKKFFGNE